MPFEPEQDDRKVAAYVGLPEGRRFDLPDILRSGVVIPGAEDYWIIQWGSRVDWDLDLNGPPSEWPSVTFREMRGLDPADVTTHTYQLWLIQAYRPGYPLAAERRWHPDLGIRDAIVGLEDQTATREDVLAAWRGHALIMAHQERSNQEIARAAELRITARAAHRLLTNGRRVTRLAIYDLMKTDRPWLEYETLLKQWQRYRPPITRRVILEEAGRL